MWQASFLKLMTMREKINEMLIKLRLRGMAEVIDDELDRAERERGLLP